MEDVAGRRTEVRETRRPRPRSRVESPNRPGTRSSSHRSDVYVSVNAGADTVEARGDGLGVGEGEADGLAVG